MTWPPRTPPPARAARVAWGRCSRPAVAAVIFGAAAEFADPDDERVSSSRPRDVRSSRSESESAIGGRQEVILQPVEVVAVRVTRVLLATNYG